MAGMFLAQGSRESARRYEHHYGISVTFSHPDSDTSSAYSAPLLHPKRCKPSTRALDSSTGTTSHSAAVCAPDPDRCVI